MPALPGPALSEEEAKREEDLIILHVDLESPARTDERHAFSEEVDVLVTELATTVSGKQIAEWINRAHLHHVSRARMGCLLALQTERNLHEAVKISQVIMHSRLGLSLRLRLSVSLARSLARALSQSSVCCLTKN